LLSLVNTVFIHDTTCKPIRGNPAVLEHTGGDQIRLQTKYTHDIKDGDEEIYCTFSGHLLFATGPSVIFGK